MSGGSERANVVLRLKSPVPIAVEVGREWKLKQMTLSFSGFTPLDHGCAGEDRNKNVPGLQVSEAEFLSGACFH